MLLRRCLLWLLAASSALLVALALPWPPIAAGEAPRGPTTEDEVAAGSESPVANAPRVAEDPPSAPTGPAAVLGEMEYDTDRGRYVAPLGGARAVLTIRPELQARLQRLLADYRVPWGATVLIEPRTGRVLAMAEHSHSEPRARELSLRALAPAASVFKIVTSAALLERGIEPEAEVCFHGGKHRIAKRQLEDDPRRDRRCLTLASALGRSANVVFAKLADRDLSGELLRTAAERFFFNVPIPFARPLEISRAEIPDEPFELATTAAGFGPVRLSPLHAALVAAIVANGGLFVPPQIVESVEGAPLPQRGEPRRVVDEHVAAALAEMMRTTVTEGTARRAFRSGRTSPLAEVTVAGKTGSLSDPKPFRDYSWFVGFAPVEDPQVAVATVIVNERLWRVRAPYVAREALKDYFSSELDGAQAFLSTAPPAVQ